jgi:Zn-finger nucleic acid-binding protein
MNCRCCGAELCHAEPIAWTVCPHCRTENRFSPEDAACGEPLAQGEPADAEETSAEPLVPGRSHRHLPAVLPVNQRGEYACPHCRVMMAVAILDDTPVELCLSCGGILVEEDQFLQLVDNRRHHPRLESEPLDEPVPDRRNERCHCPDCGQPMQAHPACGTANRLIDACRRCRLVWIEGGDLTALDRPAEWELVESAPHLVFQAKSLVPLPPAAEDVSFRFFP